MLPCEMGLSGFPVPLFSTLLKSLVTPSHRQILYPFLVKKAVTVEKKGDKKEAAIFYPLSIGEASSSFIGKKTLFPPFCLEQ